MSAAPAQTAQGSAPVFEERLVGAIAPDALRLGLVPLLGALGAALLGWGAIAVALLVLTGFVAFFFRNPERVLPDASDAVLAPADGRVIEVGPVLGPDGTSLPRVGIFLSIFDVHVNRAPVAGRVVSVERGGSRTLPAFDRRAEGENVRLALTLEGERGERIRVVQITGLIARRIVCHPRVGEWVPRGVRYGMIRFGSRTDVILPAGSELCVRRGDRVRGGSSIVARLPGGAS